MSFPKRLRPLLMGVLCLATAGFASAAGAAEGSGGSPARDLRVCVSTPDLESLVVTVGGPRVRVFAFGRGPEDPHELELRPRFAQELDRADLYVQVGLGLENAWLERLMASVRNESVKPGRPGNLNLGAGVRPLDGEAAVRVPGSFHEEGNPHYLLDPLEGLRAVREIRDRLAGLRPEWKAEFATRADEFRRRVAVALVGEACARDDDVDALVREFEALRGPAETRAFLAKHPVGGWLGDLASYRGRKIVGDHDLWPYFARRMGLTVLGYLEPSPGVPPTTRHLGEMVERMSREGVKLVLTAPYFDPRHARFVADRTGATVVAMAHQTGGRPGTATYFDMLKHNHERLLSALKEAR